MMIPSTLLITLINANPRDLIAVILITFLTRSGRHRERVVVVLDG